MEIANKWEPGKEPYHAFHAGTTQKPGITLRGEFASRFVAALLTNAGELASQDDELFINISLHLADALIEKLYPQPISKTQMNTGHVNESSACGHDGEIIIQNGRGQCMKCKQGLTPQQLMEKMKK